MENRERGIGWEMEEGHFEEVDEQIQMRHTRSS